MGFRGIKSRIFLQLWALLFLSLMILDLLVFFLSLDPPVYSLPGKDQDVLVSAPKSTASSPSSKDRPQVAKRTPPGQQSGANGLFAGPFHLPGVSFLFVVINSFLFALLGTCQLSRSYCKPLQRLARRAEAYRDETYPFFAVRKEDNEFSLLSVSLNNMLHRIANDQKVLKETIQSLEHANGELKKAQRDVMRAEKLATVGRLTSGIAHEIGNPIGIVLGYLDLLKQADVSPEERSDFIARSEREIQRIDGVIRQLLDMSRSNPGENKLVSVHRILEELMSVLQYQPCAAKIVFESKLTATEDRVVADPEQLRQMFLNLLLNAVDAVNLEPLCERRVVLSSKNVAGDADETLEPAKTYIDVAVIDNGPGFDPRQLARVFDPFFTTKAPGKGTGLGLSVAFMIVEAVGGRLVAGNNQPSGAVVDVMLPVS